MNTFNVLPVDEDSTPDDTNFNSPGETDDLADDDDVTGDGNDGGDEVDHDPAEVTVIQTFDLALTKTSNSTSVVQGGDVTYTITVLNQGTLDAYNVEVIDYIPTGMSLSTADTNGWTMSGANATNSIANIAAGQQATIDIVLTIDSNFMGTSLVNFAEISSCLLYTSPSPRD